jgi:asparagine N-glycosylation enzyme membrane subunit Stt3
VGEEELMRVHKPKAYQSLLGIVAVATISSWPPTPFILTVLAVSALVAVYLYRLETRSKRRRAL